MIVSPAFSGSRIGAQSDSQPEKAGLRFSYYFLRLVFEAAAVFEHSILVEAPLGVHACFC
jgi:hypothetical protein